MPHLLIHHQVRNFDAWKAVYDAHKPARDEAGLTEMHLFQGVNDPDEVVVLFHAEDAKKAHDFTQSKDLIEAMQRAGVVGMPSMVELA